MLFFYRMEFNIDNITLYSIKKIKNNLLLPVHYKEQNTLGPLIIQTPLVGISSIINENDKKYINLFFNQKQKEYIECLKKIEHTLLQLVYKQKKNLCPHITTFNELLNNFKSSISEDTFFIVKAKLMFRYRKFETDFFNHKNESISFTRLYTPNKGMCTLHVKNIWLTKNTISFVWNIKKIILFPFENI